MHVIRVILPLAVVLLVAVILPVALLAFAWLPPDLQVQIASLPPWLLFLAGQIWLALVGGAYVLVCTTVVRELPDPPLWPLPMTAFLGLAVAAVLAGELSPGKAAALALSGGLALVFAGVAIRRLNDGESVGLESHWGGLGGGLGGWQLSVPAAYLLFALILAALVTALALPSRNHETPNTTAPAGSTSQKVVSSTRLGT